jgi:hypothetical protein
MTCAAEVAELQQILEFPAAMPRILPHHCSEFHNFVAISMTLPLGEFLEGELV